MPKRGVTVRALLIALFTLSNIEQPILCNKKRSRAIVPRSAPHVARLDRRLRPTTEIVAFVRAADGTFETYSDDIEGGVIALAS